MTRILVVDDEPRITNFVSRALSGAGFGVDTAHDGVQGLAMARTGIYDLVVLDLLLPGLDGVSVLEGIVERDPRQSVLVLSAMSGVEQKVRCLQTGAADYLPKPFALTELLARIGARLRERSANPVPGTPAAVGRLRLEPRRRLADTGRGPVHLTEREFLLLHHLMERASDVCTREELLAEVWGYAFDPGSNVVDVCIGRLRAKLGTDVIETVRNVGYRVAAA